jgi:hypothetical protein
MRHPADSFVLSNLDPFLVFCTLHDFFIILIMHVTFLKIYKKGSERQVRQKKSKKNLDVGILHTIKLIYLGYRHENF